MVHLCLVTLSSLTCGEVLLRPAQKSTCHCNKFMGLFFNSKMYIHVQEPSSVRNSHVNGHWQSGQNPLGPTLPLPVWKTPCSSVQRLYTHQNPNHVRMIHPCNGRRNTFKLWNFSTLRCLILLPENIEAFRFALFGWTFDWQGVNIFNADFFFQFFNLQDIFNFFYLCTTPWQFLVSCHCRVSLWSLFQSKSKLRQLILYKKKRSSYKWYCDLWKALCLFPVSLFESRLCSRNGTVIASCLENKYA